MNAKYLNEALNEAQNYALEQAQNCENAVSTRKSSDPNYQAKKGGFIGGGIVLILIGLLMRVRQEAMLNFVDSNIYRPIRHWLKGRLPLGENFKLWVRANTGMWTVVSILLIIAGIYLILRMLYSLSVDSQTRKLTGLAKTIRGEVDKLPAFRSALEKGMSTGSFPALNGTGKWEKQINSLLGQKTDTNKGTAIIKTEDTVISIAMLALSGLLLWPVCIDMFSGSWSYFATAAILSVYWLIGYILAFTTTKLAAWYGKNIKFATLAAFWAFQVLLLYRLIRQGLTYSTDPFRFVSTEYNNMILNMSVTGKNHVMVLWIIVTFLVTMHMLVTNFPRESRSRASGSYVPMTNGTDSGMSRKQVRMVNKITMAVGAFYALLCAYLIPNLLNTRNDGWRFFFFVLGIGWVVLFAVSLRQRRINTYGVGRCFWLTASMYFGYLCLSVTRVYSLTGGVFAGMILCALIPLIVVVIIISMF